MSTPETDSATAASTDERTSTETDAETTTTESVLDLAGVTFGYTATSVVEDV